MKRNIIFSAGFFMLLMMPLTAVEDKLYVLRKQVIHEEKELKEFSEKIRGLQEETEKCRVRHLRRVETGKKTVADLKKEFFILKRELQQENFNLAEERAEGENFRKGSTALKKRLLAAAEKRAEKIKKGFSAHQEERLRILRRIYADCRGRHVSVEEIYSRFTASVYRDILRGFDSEVYLYEGKKYLRIGWFLLARYDAATKEAALLTRRKQKWEWIVSDEGDFRRRIVSAIKMVEGKESPDLVNFPVPLQMVRETMKGGLQ